MRYRKKRRLPLLLLLLILVIAFFSIKAVVQEFPLDSTNVFNIHHTADESRGWNLILVNRDNYIPKNYEVELTTLSNGEQVDSRIYPDLQAMFDDARAAGLQLFVRDGYRSQEEQQEILDEKIEAYRNEGYSRSEAEKLAKEWVSLVLPWILTRILLCVLKTLCIPGWQRIHISMDLSFGIHRAKRI